MRPVNRWLAIALVAGIGMASCADTAPIASPELPKEAQEFILRCWMDEDVVIADYNPRGELSLGCVGKPGQEGALPPIEMPS